MGWQLIFSRGRLAIERGHGLIALDLLDTTITVLKDIFVIAFRKSMWRRVRARRSAFADIGDIDVDGTRELLGNLCAHGKGLIQTVQVGARRDVANLVHCGIREDTRCACGAAHESLSRTSCS